MKNTVLKKKTLITEQDIKNYLNKSIPEFFNANFDGKTIFFQNGECFEISLHKEMQEIKTSR